MANNANDGQAIGLEDVPELPEAPTEQPKYNRDYHGLFVKFMSWLYKRTYTKAVGIQPHHVANYLKVRAYGTTDVDFKNVEQNPICAMFGLANYMEASFNYGYGAAGRENAFLFTPESDPKLAPKHCNAAYRNIFKAVFCRLHFWLWWSSLLVFLGVTAFGSLLQLWQEGWVLLLTKLTFEVAGRLACLDGLLMPTFCLNSPGSTPVLPKSFAWGLLDCLQAKSGCQESDSQMVDRSVVPNTHNFYSGVNDISLQLALPLLWATLDESWEERMDSPVRTRIVQAYSSIKDDLPVGVNPVVKVPFSIWTHNTKLHINEIEPMDTGGGGGTAGGTTGTTMGQGTTTGQASSRQVVNESRQLMAMQMQQLVRTNEEILARIIAQHNQLQQLIAQEGRTRDSLAAALRGWLETWLGAELRKLNGNICRIAVQPPRIATPGQVDGLTLERTSRNGQTSLRYRSAVVATPADCRPAKQAIQKPAKNFSPEEIRACKSTYARRKPLWDLMAKLVNSGKAPAWVISKIDHYYTGRVLNIAAAI
ncbi:unknown protein [Seminavis robusta]|uniref:Uncharacterized protein n=1 Tax=Seminavis robusta TaxID=568900 RepID=A0A9N8EVK5_9STRA|nr:unknown protein [Seminavis robusta]|eukprot:Sro1812_g299270.1 n/a (535) ;mRNA; r:12075-13831